MRIIVCVACLLICLACCWFFAMPEITVSTKANWESNSTLCAIETRAINTFIALPRVYVSDSGSEVRLASQRDEDVYQVTISSELFEQETFRIPASYPEIAADIVEARIKLLFPRRSGEWRGGRLNDFDRLVDLLPRIEAYDDLPNVLAELHQVRGAGVSALTLESSVARYLYESTGKSEYLSIASGAYGHALVISPNDPRVLACGIKLARAEGRETAETHLKHFRKLYPDHSSLAMLSGDYQLADQLGHRYADLEIARRSMGVDGASSLGLIEKLRPGVDARFLRAQWELLFGDPDYALAMLRKLHRETGLQHIGEWKLAALYLCGNYFEAVHGYSLVRHPRAQVWLGESWYAYAHQQLKDPHNTAYVRSLRLADEAFRRAADGEGREATLARAWLGDETVLDELPQQPETIWELWDSWRVKTLLGKRSRSERNKLELMGLTREWFR